MKLEKLIGFDIESMYSNEDGEKVDKKSLKEMKKDINKKVKRYAKRPGGLNIDAILKGMDDGTLYELISSESYMEDGNKPDIDNDVISTFAKREKYLSMSPVPSKDPLAPSVSAKFKQVLAGK